jgi:FMN-dependent NADH-azoreductase
MPRVLHLVATPRSDSTSRTRTLSAAFFSEYLGRHPGAEIEELELFHTPLPPLDAAGVAALFLETASNGDRELVAARRAELDRIAAQFTVAETYVITSPMWNFTVPYPLKHYLDLVVQLERTFRFTEHGPEGLLHGRRAVLLLSRGLSYSPGTPGERHNHLEPYLHSVLGFMGITDVTEAVFDGANLPGSEERHAAALARARALGRGCV